MNGLFKSRPLLFLLCQPLARKRARNRCGPALRSGISQRHRRTRTAPPRRSATSPLPRRRRLRLGSPSLTLGMGFRIRRQNCKAPAVDDSMFIQHQSLQAWQTHAKGVHGEVSFALRLGVLVGLCRLLKTFQREPYTFCRFLWGYP